MDLPNHRRFASFLTAVQFGLGLHFSSLTVPSRVVQFLVTPFHHDFDPTLLFLALGALPVATISYFYGRGEEKPRLGGKWSIPKGGEVDGRLLAGAAIFGIGWGIEGLCRKSDTFPIPFEMAFEFFHVYSGARTSESGDHCHSETFDILATGRLVGLLCPRWRPGRNDPALTESFRRYSPGPSSDGDHCPKRGAGDHRSAIYFHFPLSYTKVSPILSYCQIYSQRFYHRYPSNRPTIVYSCMLRVRSSPQLCILRGPSRVAIVIKDLLRLGFRAKRSCNRGTTLGNGFH